MKTLVELLSQYTPSNDMARIQRAMSPSLVKRIDQNLLDLIMAGIFPAPTPSGKWPKTDSPLTLYYAERWLPKVMFKEYSDEYVAKEREAGRVTAVYELPKVMTRRHANHAIRYGAMDFWVSSFLAFGDVCDATEAGRVDLAKKAFSAFQNDVHVILLAFDHVSNKQAAN